MALGEVKWFAQALLDLGNKLHNLGSDDLRVGLIDVSVTPVVGTSAPHWNGVGSTNFFASQVGTGGTSYTGPVALIGQSWSIAPGYPVLRANDVTLPLDALGFTNARWGILFNNTDVNKRALAFADLGVVRSIVASELILDWFSASNDILSLAQN